LKVNIMQILPVEEAVALIPDGASIMMGGFMGVGTPERIVDELVRQGKRDLTTAHITHSADIGK